MINDNVYLSCILLTSSFSGISDQGMKSMSSIHETTIRLIGTEITIFGFTLMPFVSSSKNLKRPALDAGNAALVFLSAMNQTEKLRIKSF